MKVSFHLFPPEKLTESQSKALYEMLAHKPLNIEVVSTNNQGIQVVEIYDTKDKTENRISLNTQLYQWYTFNLIIFLYFICCINNILIYI